MTKLSRSFGVYVGAHGGGGADDVVVGAGVVVVVVVVVVVILVFVVVVVVGARNCAAPVAIVAETFFGIFFCAKSSIVVPETDLLRSLHHAGWLQKQGRGRTGERLRAAIILTCNPTGLLSKAIGSDNACQAKMVAVRQCARVLEPKWLNDKREV